MAQRGDGGPRRVGVVTTSYPREEGDPAGQFVEGFARWLAGQGLSVEVVAAGPGSSSVGGLPVRRVPGRELFYAGGAPDALAQGGSDVWRRGAGFGAALLGRVLSRMVTARWDLAVSHWVLPSSLAVEAARRLTGASALRHLAIAHSSDVWMLRRSMWGRAALAEVSRRADLVYAGAHLAAVGARLGAPGRVVPMGIDVAALCGDRQRGRARFGLDRPTALFLGRLVPVKGLELLVSALPEGLDLVIAGDGPLREALARAAPPSVRLLGEVRGRDKADLLHAADLVVLPSLRLEDGRQEGSPTVLREALAAGRPVLCTDTGGAADLVGEHGVVVEPTREALHAALLRFRDHPEAWPQPPPSLAAAADWSHVGPILAAL